MHVLAHPNLLSLDRGIQYALITGAGNGIGREFAEALARRRQRLVLVQRSAPTAGRLGEIPEAYDEAVLNVSQDLAEPDAAQRVYEFCRERNLRVSMLVNNAGFGMHAAFAEQELPEIERMMCVNMNSLVALTRLFLPQMIERGSGTIVNVASTAAFGPAPYWAVYGATKAFVQCFTESLQEELRGSGVYVTSVCPGVTRTNFHTRAGATLPDSNVQTPREVVDEALEGMDRRMPLIVTGRYNRIRIKTQRVNLRQVLANVKGGLRRVGVVS